MTEKEIQDFVQTNEDLAVVEFLQSVVDPDQERLEREHQEREERWEAIRKAQQEAYEKAVSIDIAKLRKDAEDNLLEADRLERLLTAYPNLKKHTGRWSKVAYFSKDVNTLVNGFDARHNCGCCSDSPLEIWPFLDTPDGRVYSDPASFVVGEQDPYRGGDTPHAGWREKLRMAGIPEPILDRIASRMNSDEAEEETEPLL